MTPEQQLQQLQAMQKQQQAAAGAPHRKVIPVKRELASSAPKEKEGKKGSKGGGIRAFFGFGKKKKTVEHSVGSPYNLKHNVHVDFTTKTGFVGLPTEWESTLLSSGVNIEKYTYIYIHIITTSKHAILS